MFEPRNELERLLIAAVDDVDSRPAFTKAILEGKLAVATQSREQNSPPRGVPLQNGDVAAALFTAPERVAEVFGPEAGVLYGPARQVLDWLRENPVVLNPGTDYGVVWTPRDIALMLDRVSSDIITKDTQVMLGMPSERPQELIDRLTEALGPSGTVSEAYLMMAHRSDQPDPTLMLGITTTGDWDAAMAVIGKAVEGYEFGDLPLDLMELNDDPIGQTLRTGIPIVPKS